MATNEVIRCRLNLQRPVATTDAKSSRYALGNALVTPTDNGVFLAGTDGRCLSVARADGECPDGKEHYAPTAIVDKMPKRGKRAELNGQWTVDAKTIIPPTQAQRFPQVQDVLPSLAAKPPVFAIRLNADLLAKVQASISEGVNDGLVLLLASPDSPIVAMGAHGVGMVMPIQFGERGEANDAALARHVSRYEMIRTEYAAARAKFNGEIVNDELHA